jgi:hypothetical protein
MNHHGVARKGGAAFNARQARHLLLKAMKSVLPMHLECCPACGQPKLTGDLLLPPLKKRLLEIVRRRPGITAEELRSLVWAEDPNGGPEDRKCLHVHVHQLNRLLAPLGLVIRGSVSGGYRMRAL